MEISLNLKQFLQITKSEVSEPSVIRKYCYDGDRVIAEYDNGFIKASFIYGPGIDEPIAILSTSLYYYHYDGLGSASPKSQVLC